MTVNGCDLSHWNPFPKIAPYDFIFIKATQGGTAKDPTYQDRAQRIRSSAKVFGAYHFLTTGVPVALQVVHFLDIVRPQSGDVLILDFEDDDTWHTYTRQFLATLATQWMHMVMKECPHNRVLLYCNRSTYSTIVAPYSVPVSDGLWISSPTSTPMMKWLFWQYGTTGVDLDRGDFPDLAHLKRWAESKEDDMNLDDVTSVESPRTRGLPSDQAHYSETHTVRELLGDAMYWASDANKNAEASRVMLAQVLANQAHDDLSSDAVLGRLTEAYQEAARHTIMDTVQPALRDTVRDVLGEDQAELADVFLRELGKKLAANQPPSQ